MPEGLSRQEWHDRLEDAAKQQFAACEQSFVRARVQMNADEAWSVWTIAMRSTFMDVQEAQQRAQQQQCDNQHSQCESRIASRVVHGAPQVRTRSDRETWAKETLDYSRCPAL
eukprot:5158831-Alexandrium_andersonii.AAC.1